MTIAITATFLASIAYFTLAFIAHIVKGVCDRHNQIIKVQPPVETVVEPVFVDGNKKADHIPAAKKMVSEPAPKVMGVITFQPSMANQTANLYQQLTIRQLKKLASGRVSKYSNMTKVQLIAALA